MTQFNQTKYQAATGWSNVPILEWATPSLTVWLQLKPETWVRNGEDIASDYKHHWAPWMNG